MNKVRVPTSYISNAGWCV